MVLEKCGPIPLLAQVFIGLTQASNREEGEFVYTDTYCAGECTLQCVPIVTQFLLIYYDIGYNIKSSNRAILHE